MKNINKKLPALRKWTLLLVFVLVILSLAFDSGLGTPCSFGISQFFLLCPLGGLEALLASKAFVPVTLISLGVMIIFSLIFGRAWCAWGCPAPVIRSFFKREPQQQKENQSVKHDQESSAHSCDIAAQAWSLKESLKFIGKDRRTWVLLGVLIATLIAGFPIFCLVCPIGLTFGTVGSLWHFFVDKQITMSVVVFPLALVFELIVYRRWCLDVCPVAGLLNIFGQFARLGRPSINSSTCLRSTQKANCQVCTLVCTESINKHSVNAVQQLGACTRCGECAKHCPTASISLNLKINDPVSHSED